ncbi:MAG TPA: fibronectin type III domain-containing protein [Candidatus Aenigmarchaeota archaeon]|nr:fibronectin type III domain-containing protein [Candidatus Aenigmarchaeota archaeon]
MKIKIIIVSCILLLILFILNATAKEMSCAITTSCSTPLLYLKNETNGYYNAHAQLPSIATYPYALCCESNKTIITNTCEDNVFLRLYKQTNSHVQIGNYSGPYSIYSYKACISAKIGSIECLYQPTCPPGYECLLSIASSEAWAENKTNAHVGPCEEYQTKVCCRIVDPPVVSFIYPTPPNGSRRINNNEIINVSVVGDADIDTCILEWNGINESMDKIGNGWYVYCQKAKVTSDGTTYFYRVYVNDSFGNMNATPQQWFRENAKPEVNVTIIPTNPTTIDDLNCSVSGWDKDGDNLYYYFRWYKNGQLVYESYQNLSYYVILHGNTTKNEVWNCSVIPYDGYENGSMKFDSRIILNSPPTLDSIQVNQTCVAYNQPVEVTSINASDNDKDDLILRISSYPKGFDLCNSTPGQPERMCTMLIPWSDSATHAIYGLVEDTDHSYSPERNTTITTDNSGPDPPFSLSPANNTALNITTITLSWEAPSDNGCSQTIAGYHLQITSSPTCDSGIINETYLQTNQYNISLGENVYYWHVRAKDGLGNYGTWSDCNKLIIDTQPPNKVSLVSPLNNTCTLSTTNFKWNETTDNGYAGIYYYHFQLSNTTYFGELEKENLTEQTNITQVLAIYRTYYWRVRAVDRAFNYGPYSDIWSITTGDSSCNGIERLACPNNGYICNETCHYTDRDYSKVYCEYDIKCNGFVWLSYAIGNSCCGDDGEEDDIEQVADDGRSCCYNGQVLVDDSAIASILCDNGELYDCNGVATDDSGLAEHKSTGDIQGIKYCTANNTWVTATMLSANAYPRVSDIYTPVLISASYIGMDTNKAIENATVIITIYDEAGNIMVNNQYMTYNYTSHRYDYYYTTTKRGVHIFVIQASKPGYQTRTVNGTFAAVVGLSIVLYLNESDGNLLKNLTRTGYYVLYEKNNMVKGFVPLGIPKYMSIEQIGNQYRLEILQPYTKPTTLLVYTKYKRGMIKSAIELIREGRFFDLVSPSFAYHVMEKYPIEVILKNKKINITGEKLGLGKGYHEIEIWVKKARGKKREIEIKKLR